MRFVPDPLVLVLSILSYCKPNLVAAKSLEAENKERISRDADQIETRKSFYTSDLLELFILA